MEELQISPGCVDEGKSSTHIRETSYARRHKSHGTPEIVLLGPGGVVLGSIHMTIVESELEASERMSFNVVNRDKGESPLIFGIGGRGNSDGNIVRIVESSRGRKSEDLEVKSIHSVYICQTKRSSAEQAGVCVGAGGGCTVTCACGSGRGTESARPAEGWRRARRVATSVFYALHICIRG